MGFLDFRTVLTYLIAALAVVAMIAIVARVPIKYNVRNLLVRWRTTALTALAFTLVVGLLTVMLAFVNGMYVLTESSGQPANVILLSEGSTDEGFSNFAFADVGDIETQPGIQRLDDRPMVSREAFFAINQPIVDAPPDRPKRRFLQVRGLDDPAMSGAVHGLTLEPGGQWFSEAGVRELRQRGEEAIPAAIEVVLGSGIARELGLDRREPQNPNQSQSDPLKVGDQFQLGDRPWVVAGILESQGTVFDSEVWAKRAVVGPLFGKEAYTSIVVRAADAAAAIQLREYFENDYTKAQLEAFTEPEYFASLGETNRQFLVGILFVTLIMAIGGVMGIMNTMFAAISQRTRDIGVLRLLGFSRWRVVVSFLLEAVLIGLVGGALGVAIGSLVHGWSATSIVSSGAGGKTIVLQLTVDAAIIATGLLFSLVMGLLGGLFPTLLRAVRLRPLEALR